MNTTGIDWVAIAALVVSAISLFLSWRATAKTEAISRENTNIQHAMIENDLRQSIETSTSKINEIAMIMLPFTKRKELGTITTEEDAILDGYHLNFNAAIQAMLNTYDGVCSKYLDGKIDKSRFKKSYHVEIRNLVERKDLKDYFDSNTSRYKPIIKVYKEWNDHEEN